MAYFDSSKNRALWEIELQNLKKLRAERAAGKHVVKSAAQQQTAERSRVRMTYQELLQEETLAAQKAPGKERQAAMQAAKVRQKEALQNEPPQKEARAYGKV